MPYFSPILFQKTPYFANTFHAFPQNRNKKSFEQVLARTRLGLGNPIL